MAEQDKLLLTETEAELAWHFSPDNNCTADGDRGREYWANEPRIKLTPRDLVLLKAQLAKVLPIKDAECQQRVERIFREIENTIITKDASGVKEQYIVRQGGLWSNWQALKKREGIG